MYMPASYFFQRATTFVLLVCFPLLANPSHNGAFLKGTNLLPKEDNSFSFRVAPNWQGMSKHFRQNCLPWKCVNLPLDLFFLWIKWFIFLVLDFWCYFSNPIAVRMVNEFWPSATGLNQNHSISFIQCINSTNRTFKQSWIHKLSSLKVSTALNN